MGALGCSGVKAPVQHKGVICSAASPAALTCTLWLSEDRKEKAGDFCFSFLSLFSLNKSSRLLPQNRDRPPKKQDLWVFGNVTEKKYSDNKRAMLFFSDGLGK